MVRETNLTVWFKGMKAALLHPIQRQSKPTVAVRNKRVGGVFSNRWENGIPCADWKLRILRKGRAAGSQSMHSQALAGSRRSCPCCFSFSHVLWTSQGVLSCPPPPMPRGDLIASVVFWHRLQHLLWNQCAECFLEKGTGNGRHKGDSGPQWSQNIIWAERKGPWLSLRAGKSSPWLSPPLSEHSVPTSESFHLREKWHVLTTKAFSQPASCQKYRSIQQPLLR